LQKNNFFKRKMSGFQKRPARLLLSAYFSNLRFFSKVS
jgi:hypothetical protein